MANQHARWQRSGVAVVVILGLLISVLGTTPPASVQAQRSTLPPELTAAPADTAAIQLLAGSEVDWFTTVYYATMSFSRWTLPPGTETEAHFQGLALFSVERGEVAAFDRDGLGEYTIDPDHPLSLRKDDQNSYALRNASDDCASVLVLRVDSLDSPGGGGGQTWTDEQGPRLASEAPCGERAEEHTLVRWHLPFGLGSQRSETFSDGPLYLFIARKTIEQNKSTGSTSFTGPVGMYLEDGLLWQSMSGGATTLLSPGGLTLVPAGQRIDEQTTPDQAATLLLFGIVSADSEPGPILEEAPTVTGLSTIGNAYRHPEYPFSLSWNYSWVVTDASTYGIALTNGSSLARFTIATTYPDSESCVNTEASVAIANEASDDYVVAQDGDGNELRGPSSNDSGYFGIYFSPTAGPVHYVECLTLGGTDAQLVMHFTIDYASYANEARALDDLRARIRLDDGPPVPSAPLT